MTLNIPSLWENLILKTIFYCSSQAGLICGDIFALVQVSLGREEGRNGKLMLLRLLCWLRLWKEGLTLEFYTLQNSPSLGRAFWHEAEP